MKHLFKLKKNGKTVGLMKITDGAVWTTVTVLDINLKLVGFDPSWDSAWCVSSDTEGLKPTIDFDTAHPFVTQDKNGKDVFEGDSVKSGKRILTIIWNDDQMQWQAEEEGGRYCLPLCEWAISEQFELIEDKDEESI